MSNTIKIRGEKVPVDPVLLFQRTSITTAFHDEIENFFKYELAPYPLSLFNEVGMRKSQTSAMYVFFFKVDIDIDNLNVIYNIDGGYLLHRVVWDRDDTFSNISDKYVQYIRRHFGQGVTEVFDGYTDSTKKIKAAEQRRRMAKTSASSDTLFDQFMTIPTSQQ